MKRPILIAALLMPLSAAAQSAPDAARTFASRCAKCHAVERVQGLLAKRSGDRAAFLDGFLKKHYPPGDAERAALVAFLLKAP